MCTILRAEVSQARIVQDQPVTALHLIFTATQFEDRMGDQSPSVNLYHRGSHGLFQPEQPESLFNIHSISQDLRVRHMVLFGIKAWGSPRFCPDS